MAVFMFQMLKMNVIAGLVTGLVILICRLTGRRYSSRWKYWTWLAIAVFLLVPVNVSEISPVKVTIYEDKEEPAALQEAEVSGIKPAARPFTKGSSQAFEEEGVAPAGLLRRAFWIWILGLTALAVTRGLRYQVSLRKLRRWSYPVTDEQILQWYRKVCREQQVKNPPRLMVSGLLSTPVLAGLLQPGLYLTQESYNMQELRFVFSHELCHYRRKDLWYKMLLLAVTTVHWYNPCLHWMWKDAEKDIENLCDTGVVKHYTREEKNHYNRVLLKTAVLQNHVPYLATGLNDGPGIFKKRILYMRHLSSMKERLSFAAVLAATMVVGNVLVGSSVQAKEPQRPVEKEAPAPMTEAEKENPIREAEAEKPVAFWPVSQAEQPKAESTEPEAEVALEAAEEEEKGQDMTEKDFPEEDANSGEEISEEIPDWAQTAEQQGITLTEEQRTLWTADGSGATYIYRATDGNWYDGSGRGYEEIGSGNWTSQGMTWTEEEPPTPEDTAVGQLEVRDAEGYNEQVLYQDEHGSWVNGAGGVYTPDENGNFTGPDGNIWYIS